MKNEFVMFVGPMFGGKTSKLLSALDRYKYQGKNIIAFKPNIDERYCKNKIVTHWGGNFPAVNVKSGQDILRFFIKNKKDSKNVIAVDEAFMIEGSGLALKKIFEDGHTVLVSSLQISSDFTPYEEIQKMMPYATKIELCPAVCSICGLDAYYTQKTAGRSDHKIEVGGSEMYQPRCFSHFVNLS